MLYGKGAIVQQRSLNRSSGLEKGDQRTDFTYLLSIFSFSVMNKIGDSTDIS